MIADEDRAAFPPPFHGGGVTRTAREGGGATPQAVESWSAGLPCPPKLEERRRTARTFLDRRRPRRRFSANGAKLDHGTSARNYDKIDVKTVSYEG